MTVLMANGGYGDCFDAACEADRRFWAGTGTQVLGWFAIVIVLTIVAHRLEHNVWLAVAALTVIGGLAGVITAEQGPTRDPKLFGLDVPTISPAFMAWAPGAFVMTVGALMIWLGARQSRFGGM
jgi:hypothetical protein